MREPQVAATGCLVLCCVGEPQKNSKVRKNALFSRQSLVKGERLAVVYQNYRQRKTTTTNCKKTKNMLGVACTGLVAKPTMRWFLYPFHGYVSRSDIIVIYFSAAGGRRATPVNRRQAGVVPREETLFFPPGLCRAILPALFPAWAVSRYTIHQLSSSYFESSLREIIAHPWRERLS